MSEKVVPISAPPYASPDYNHEQLPGVITTQPVAPSIVQQTVVLNQPMVGKHWNTQLCDCCADVKICCCVCCCGGWYYGCVADRMGENCCVGLCGSSGGFVPGGHIAMRSTFRAKHSIEPYAKTTRMLIMMPFKRKSGKRKTDEGYAARAPPAYRPNASGSEEFDAITVQPTSPTVVQTTVVVNQPMMGKHWNTGLFDCFADMTVCCYACCCCNFYFACIAGRMGENCCVGLCGDTGGCVSGGHLAMRSAFRAKHGIEGSICSDCVVTTFCSPCAFCQLSRELDYQGYP